MTPSGYCGKCLVMALFGHTGEQVRMNIEDSNDEVVRLKRELDSLREELRQCRDAEKAHRKELEFKNLILDTIQATIVVVYAKGNNALCYANKYSLELAGYTLEELKAVPGMWESPTLSDEEKKRYAEYFRRMWAGERPLSWESWYFTKNKEQRRAIYTSTILDDEQREPEYVIASGIDITELHEAREHLRRAKEAAENATQLKDKFVALVSHDLRSPLASLVQHIKALENEMAGFTKEEIAHTYGVIIGQCESMMNLIDRLLNLGRIRSGKIVLDRVPLDLKALVNEVYGSMEHLAKGKNLSLDNRLPETARVSADRDLFAEVIRNLLSNAIKFSHEGGTVSVYEPGDGAQLVVRDSGMGIPDGMLPHLFAGEIKTTRSGTAGELGTGFGLPLCREIIELHGGHISAEAVEGEGSAFFLRLPLD